MACMKQTYLVRYKNGILIDRLQEKINYSIRYAQLSTYNVQPEQVSSVK